MRDSNPRGWRGRYSSALPGVTVPPAAGRQRGGSPYGEERSDDGFKEAQPTESHPRSQNKTEHLAGALLCFLLCQVGFEPRERVGNREFPRGGGSGTAGFPGGLPLQTDGDVILAPSNDVGHPRSHEKTNHQM